MISTGGSVSTSTTGLASRTSLRTTGGHGRGAACSGRMPLLRAQKSFCGGEPLGTGPA
ncbi:MAG: hypothetical protein ACKOB1_10640 [Planctomycetia bacterium]